MDTSETLKHYKSGSQRGRAFILSPSMHNSRALTRSYTHLSLSKFGQRPFPHSIHNETLALEEEHVKISIHRTALVVTAVSALVGVPFVSGLASAADTHKTEALAHARKAIEQGKGKHAEALKQHTEEALKHAKEAKKDQHVEEGIKHLQEAVNHASKVEAATRHVEEAVPHLSAED